VFNTQGEPAPNVILKGLKSITIYPLLGKGSNALNLI